MMNNRTMNFTEINNNQIVLLHINKMVKDFNWGIIEDYISHYYYSDYDTGEYDDGFIRAVNYTTLDKNSPRIILKWQMFKLYDNERLRKIITNYDELLEQTIFYKNLKLLDEL